MAITNTLTVFFIAVTITAITGCRGGAHGSVKYGLNQVFMLADGEKEISATKERVSVYENLCVPADLNMPVNRIIEAPSYVIFISFADTAIHLENYIALIRSEQSIPNIINREQSFKNATLHALRFSKAGASVCQFWKSAQVAGMQEVFTVISNDSSFIQNAYDNAQYLETRLP